jgi:hypothetical protein
MEFDIKRVYSPVNADELKPGSKVIVADTFEALKTRVMTDNDSYILEHVREEGYVDRFGISENSNWVLAYLISEPEEKKLKVSDLKLGDIVRHKSGNLEYLVIGIDHSENEVFFGDDWSDDTDLINWEKVEND